MDFATRRMQVSETALISTKKCLLKSRLCNKENGNFQAVLGLAFDNSTIYTGAHTSHMDRPGIPITSAVSLGSTNSANTKGISTPINDLYE